MNYEPALKGSTAVSHPTRIASARENLLANGKLPENTVRAVIQASWERCVSNQVDPLIAKKHVELSGTELNTIRLQHQELMTASDIIMREARDLLADSGTIMHLVSPSGMILDYEGDPATLDLARSYSLIPGANWNEQLAGTNAIGTALNIQAPVQVHGVEHFCENISAWTCSASIIKDPFEKRLLGALNISGLKNTLNEYCLALAISGARRIEGQFAQLKLAKRDLLLGSTINHFATQTNDGILLFDLDGKLVRANAIADRVTAARGIRMDLTPHNPILTLNAEDTPPPPPSQSPLSLLDEEWIEKVEHQGEHIGYLAVIPLPSRPTQNNTSRIPCIPPPSQSTGFFRLVGQSEPFLKAVKQTKRIAKAPIPVLLQGETGVGKELFARAMHEEGSTQSGEFIALNCGGLSRDLLAAELFGHVEGAFTGAKRGGMEGKIEAANGGTLFLDEIGEMPLDLQPMFLRVLQESEICRVGETRPRKVNFRLVAATNRDLTQEVAEGRFRMDLFYRISSMTLTVPPLRERKGDVALLAQNIFSRLVEEHPGEQKFISQSLLNILEKHNWPGNIRELNNLITAAFFLSENDILEPCDLPKDFVDHHKELLSDTPDAPNDSDINPLILAEKEVISKAIREQNGNLTRAAKQLNIAKSTLYVKMRKYSIERP